jgi:hypothetical protein
VNKRVGDFNSLKELLMRQTFRRTMLVATAVVGLSASIAVAAPPTANDQNMTNSPTMNNSSGPGSSTAMPQPGAATGTQTQASQAQPNGGKLENRIEQRIADLQNKLQISAAQKPQWDRFTQIMRENARDMDRIFQTRVQSLDTMNAEDNMKSYAMIATHHAQDVQRLVPAFDALYTKMNDSQKRTADQVFREEAYQGNRQSNG